jgi:hypothetical protein
MSYVLQPLVCPQGDKHYTKYHQIIVYVKLFAFEANIATQAHITLCASRDKPWR